MRKGEMELTTSTNDFDWSGYRDLANRYNATHRRTPDRHEINLADRSLSPKMENVMAVNHIMYGGVKV